MKVTSAQSHVRGSSGISEQRAFSIRNNAHAYKMLSSGLYSDKIRAVLREIGCNATDAHIEHGTPDRPIEVKLPNRIDRQFYIRDWGPGLSHEDVMELYTTYFASTKQTSNEFTGAFGLGSKSPFSYTDAFSVVSAHGGKKRTYSAHIGADGLPTIALLTTEDAGADWQHGLMIGFPVKPEDYHQFADRAQAVFQWFRVSPKVEGAKAVEPMKYAFDSPEFSRHDTDTGITVLMGNVSYPLSHHSLQGLSPLGAKMFDFPGIVLRVPIGEVQVAASREELQYDKATTAYLNRRCEETALFIAKDMERVLVAFKSASWKDKCETPQLESRWRPGSGRYYSWANFFQAAGLKDAAELAQILANRFVPVPKSCGKTTMFRVVSSSRHSAGKATHVVVSEGMLPADRYGNRERATIQLEPDTKVFHGKPYLALVKARDLILQGTAKQVVLVTSSAIRGGDEAAAKAEAERLCREVIMGEAPVDIDTVTVPAGYVQAGGKRAKKAKLAGGKLPPLQSQMVGGLSHKGEVKVDVAAAAPHFMVRAHHGYSARRFESTMDKDKLLSTHEWQGLLKNANDLQDELGTKALDTAHVFVPFEVMRALDLPKRGWRSTYDVIRDWVHDQKTRDEVAAVAGKWRPTVAIEDLGYHQTWVSFLISLREHQPKVFDAARKQLKFPGLVQAVDDIHAASKAAGKNAGRKSPAVIDLYARLQVEFGAPPVTGTAGARMYIDPADLNAQLLAKYPLFAMFGAADAHNILMNAPDKLEGFLQFLHH